MRPTDRPSGAVWQLLEEWRIEQQEADPFGRKPTQGEMAQLFGVSTQLISSWKYMQSRLQSDDLATISEKTEISPGDLVRAALLDLPTVLANIYARRPSSGDGRAEAEAEARRVADEFVAELETSRAADRGESDTA